MATHYSTTFSALLKLKQSQKYKRDPVKGAYDLVVGDGDPLRKAKLTFEHYGVEKLQSSLHAIGPQMEWFNLKLSVFHIPKRSLTCRNWMF